MAHGVAATINNNTCPIAAIYSNSTVCSYTRTLYALSNVNCLTDNFVHKLCLVQSISLKYLVIYLYLNQQKCTFTNKNTLRPILFVAWIIVDD